MSTERRYRSNQALCHQVSRDYDNEQMRLVLESHSPRTTHIASEDGLDDGDKVHCFAHCGRERVLSNGNGGKLQFDVILTRN